MRSADSAILFIYNLLLQFGWKSLLSKNLFSPLLSFILESRIYARSTYTLAIMIGTDIFVEIKVQSACEYTC